MSLQFIMGNSGAGKSRYAYEKILAEAARHPEKNYLIVLHAFSIVELMVCC